MLELCRTVRFCLNSPAGPAPEARGRNGFGGWPAMRGLGRYYELRVRCEGDADPATGYFINIAHIDQAVREHAIGFLSDLLTARPDAADIAMGDLMRGLLRRLNTPLRQTVQRLALQLTPCHALEMESHDMGHVRIRQQYEFSAAHRLHVPALGEQKNREIFGKCNNPSGHGHNYVLEVVVQAPIGGDGQVVALPLLDQLVEEAVVRKLDHKHLNIDVPEFRDLNPTVENIARVIHGLLASRIGELNVALAEVSVWETPKTVCTFRG